MASRFFPKSLKLSSDSAPENETIQHRDTWIVALARLLVLLLPVAFLHIPPKLHAIDQKKGGGVGGRQDWQLSRSTSLSRTQFGTPGNSPSPPWSLALSTQLLHGCPSIISGLGSDLRSAAVAIAVEPSPRWICCCCFSCCLAARRCSPLTSSSALSDILSARM